MAPIRDWTGAITFFPTSPKNNPRKCYSIFGDYFLGMWGKK